MLDHGPQAREQRSGERGSLYGIHVCVSAGVCQGLRGLVSLKCSWNGGTQVDKSGEEVQGENKLSG